VLSVYFGVVPAQLIMQGVWLVDLGCTLSTRAEAGGMLSLLRVVSFVPLKIFLLVGWAVDHNLLSDGNEYQIR